MGSFSRFPPCQEQAEDASSHYGRRLWSCVHAMEGALPRSRPSRTRHQWSKFCRFVALIVSQLFSPEFVSGQDFTTSASTSILIQRPRRRCAPHRCSDLRCLKMRTLKPRSLGLLRNRNQRHAVHGRVPLRRKAASRGVPLRSVHGRGLPWLP